MMGQQERRVHTTTTLPLRLKRSIKWLALGTGIGMMAVCLIDRRLSEKGLIRIEVEIGGVRESEGKKCTRILKETLCRA